MRPRLPPCSGVKESEIYWGATPIEIELDRQFARARTWELEEQREWLAAQTKRLAAIALEIDNGLREAALIEEMERQDAWWITTAEREKESNAALMKIYQDAMDKETKDKMLARVEKAGKKIRSDAAYFEKQELKRRGIYRGR